MEKWDDKMMQPKESGWSVDDVIDFVRKKMYAELVSPSNNGTATDGDSESEEIVGAGGAVEKENINRTDVIDDGGEVVRTSIIAKKRGKDDDDDYNDNSSSSTSSSDSDTEDIPDDWMFPSFNVFVLWGPYVEPELRLNIAMLDD